MIDYYKIKSVEIEASSYCNAACPLCPRNVFGYPYQNGYTPTHLTLENTTHIFDFDFIKQLEKITFEGNLGDPLMNPQLLEIISFFKEVNDNLEIDVYTNASLGTTKFWESLAKQGVQLFFAIDGMEDTHSIYRRGTDFKKIISNANIFISAGGNAVWKMIKFDHNKHQIDECHSIADLLGFKKFIVVDHGRNAGPVFDKNGNLEYVLGTWKGETDLTKILDIIQHGDILIEDIDDVPTNSIDCAAIENQSIYISAVGEVYPCCFMGFNPNSFGHGTWHQPVNAQIKNLISKNNALQYSLKECIEWFEKIPSCWNKKDFNSGRLIVCNQHCSPKK